LIAVAVLHRSASVETESTTVSVGADGARKWPGPDVKPVDTPNALEILERRFAEGAISVDDYRERRKVLVNGTAGGNDANNKEPLTAPRAGGGSQ
jgi:hypothetical protein